MIKLKYRPEIDTLRAIAVLAVIIYHANFYLFGNLVFSGGYLGVDIFFIISDNLYSSTLVDVRPRKLIESNLKRELTFPISFFLNFNLILFIKIVY